MVKVVELAGIALRASLLDILPSWLIASRRIELSGFP